MLPLNAILWAYEHSKIHRFLWFKLKQSYTIHFTCNRNIKFSLVGYNKEQLDSLMDFLKENYPDIIIGYSLENKKTISELISNKKDCR